MHFPEHIAGMKQRTAVVAPVLSQGCCEDETCKGSLAKCRARVRGVKSEISEWLLYFISSSQPALPWPGMPPSRNHRPGSLSVSPANFLSTGLACSMKSTGPGTWSFVLKNEQRSYSKIIAPMIIWSVVYIPCGGLPERCDIFSVPLYICPMIKPSESKIYFFGLHHIGPL